MPNELRPRVAELLRGEHRTHSVTMAALSSGDTDELREIADGATYPHYRVKALALLAEAGPRQPDDLFRGALRDDAADAGVRAAGATWLARSAPADAEASLIAALGTEPTSAVRHKIVGGLARVGAEDSLAALSTLASNDPNLSAHAAFASSVVAYRSGRTGYEVPAAEAFDLLPGPSQEATPAVLPASDAVPLSASDLAGDTYGVAMGGPAAQVSCGGRLLTVALDPAVHEGLLTTPAVAGLVAVSAESDGSLATSMLVLCRPGSNGEVHIAVHHTSGTPVYAGAGRIDGGSIRFRLDAVAGPGARAATVTGTVTGGVLDDLRVDYGAAQPKLQPTPIP